MRSPHIPHSLHSRTRSHSSQKETKSVAERNESKAFVRYSKGEASRELSRKPKAAQRKQRSAREPPGARVGPGIGAKPKRAKEVQAFLRRAYRKQRRRPRRRGTASPASVCGDCRVRERLEREAVYCRGEATTRVLSLSVSAYVMAGGRAPGPSGRRAECGGATSYGQRRSVAKASVSEFRGGERAPLAMHVTPAHTPLSAAAGCLHFPQTRRYRCTWTRCACTCSRRRTSCRPSRS